MSQVQQSKKDVLAGWRKRWPRLLGGVLLSLLVGYVALWLLRPGAEDYAPEVLATIQPGMTRQEVETTLGRPLAPQMGRRGIMVRSNQPARSSTPGLTEEEGLDLYFDDQGILRESNGWGFVRPESISERMRRWLGL